METDERRFFQSVKGIGREIEFEVDFMLFYKGKIVPYLLERDMNMRRYH
jgi:hypothetical protein